MFSVCFQNSRVMFASADFLHVTRLGKICKLMSSNRTSSESDAVCLLQTTKVFFCIVFFFYWSSRGSAKEVVAYCTSCWHSPRKSLKRRNELCDASQPSSLCPKSASATSDGQKQALLYSAGLLGIVRATDSVKEVRALAGVHSADEHSDPLSQFSCSYLDVTKKQ